MESVGRWTASHVTDSRIQINAWPCRYHAHELRVPWMYYIRTVPHPDEWKGLQLSPRMR